MIPVGKYDMHEVLSALQKSIRRGDERSAVYWATALDIAGGSYPSTLWRRLFTIASEDIGVANSNAIVQLKTLYECWEGDKDYGEKKLHLIHAVVMLARSPKSRICDHLCILAYGGARPNNIAIPDYAIDKHTRRGRKLERGFKHFFEEGAKLAPSWNGVEPLPDPYERKCREYCEHANGKPKQAQVEVADLEAEADSEAFFADETEKGAK